MKKHITMAIILFLATLFVLPMTAFGRSRKNVNYRNKIMVRMAPQAQVQTPSLTAEGTSRIEDLQKRLQDENADTLKQLMVKNQKEITADIQKEISDLNAKLGES
jgi:hypothetical protein